jgi:adenosylcobinamide-phosphate synthase
VGSFEDAIDGWRNQESRFAYDSDGVVLAATSGAVNIQLGGPTIPTSLQPTSTDTSSVPLALPSRQTPEIAHFPVIVGLVWRTVVMWMVLLALLTLARLLG